MRLKAALAQHRADYDFVLIDCPPSLSMLTLNGLCAAHGVIIPMQCEYYALEGLSDLVNTIKKVHANLNRDLKIIGLLRVMFDPRSTLSNQVSAQLEEAFRRQGVQDPGAAQRAAGRGTQLWHPRRAVRQGGQGSAGLHGLRRGNDRTCQFVEGNRREPTQTKRPRPRARCIACRQQRAETQRQETLAVGALQPGKYQPRTRMDPGSLEELAASIKAQGLIQPISVRPVGAGRFEIIAGERRWRAAQIAGLERGAGAGARHSRRCGAGDVADRKHSARRPQSA
jgi:hypothetical protein